MDSLSFMNAILNQFAEGLITAEERDVKLKGLVEVLKAENLALKARAEQAEKPSKLTLKVSNKGAISLYGMGRFPVTLHKDQWLRVFGMADEAKAFITANESILRVKGEDDAAYEKRTGRHVVTDAERKAEADAAGASNTYRTGDGETSRKAV